MERLQPLDDDYYGTSGWYSGGEVDSDSSEDEITRHMRRIAEGATGSSDEEQQEDADGMSSKSKRRQKPIYEPGTSKAKEARHAEFAAFESSMANELNSNLLEFSAETWMPELRTFSKPKPPAKEKKVKFTGVAEEAPTTSKKASAKTAEQEVDPALGLNDEANDSDEEFCKAEGISKESKDEQERTAGNDALFYDPDEDADNEKWVEKQKAQRRGNSWTADEETRKGMPSRQKASTSDAILNCPACMTLLCLDCQRHAVYKTQYRAMFVENCRMNTDIQVFMPSEERQPKRLGKRKKMKRVGDAMDTDEAPSGAPIGNTRYPHGEAPATCAPEDLFAPVECSVCRTEVGVIDSDEVYHFFNVLSSYT